MARDVVGRGGVWRLMGTVSFGCISARFGSGASGSVLGAASATMPACRGPAGAAIRVTEYTSPLGFAPFAAYSAKATIPTCTTADNVTGTPSRVDPMPDEARIATLTAVGTRFPSPCPQW